MAQFGPQELEQDITDIPPGDRVESFLCALLSLVLNRKQDVKYGTPLRPSNTKRNHGAPMLTEFQN
jgi:hypothetical protein